MKKLVFATLVLLFSVGTIDVSAQGFLKNLGRSIEQSVKNEVKKKVKKEINEAIESVGQEQQKELQEPKQESKQSVSKPVVDPTDIPITTMGTWLLVVKDGKPHYDFIDNPLVRREKYYLEDIKYEHPDGVKPFMFTTAIATFKAKDGFYFDKKLKLNEVSSQAENTTGFKRVDAKTVKVYLTAFTGAMDMMLG